jgi:putative intracellular protease/amidase
MTIRMKAINCLLIIIPNIRLAGTLNKTGVCLGDLAGPYYTFRDAGEFVTLASPKGGQIPLGPVFRSGEEETWDTKRYQADAQAMYHFSHSLPLKEIRAEHFDLAFVAGGYGSIWDFPGDEDLKRLLDDFIARDKPIGLIGRAVVALLGMTIKNGDPLVKGRGITACSNSEEKIAGLSGMPPFLLETKLLALGADYRAGADFSSYVVVDENIVTGQNSVSAIETATRLLERARSGENQERFWAKRMITQT